MASRRKKRAPRKAATRGSGSPRPGAGGSGRKEPRAKSVADSRRELEGSEKLYYRSYNFV